MQAFYKHWLDQETSDPTAALRATQRAYIAAGQPLSTWAPFIIVGA
jgi:CHAT domain-containing protein